LMVERSLTNYSQDSCREEFVVDGRCFGEGYYGDFCHIGNVFNQWPVFITWHPTRNFPTKGFGA
jgi:hypothetical protein